MRSTRRPRRTLQMSSASYAPKPLPAHVHVEVSCMKEREAAAKKAKEAQLGWHWHGEQTSHQQAGLTVIDQGLCQGVLHIRCQWRISCTSCSRGCSRLFAVSSHAWCNARGIQETFFLRLPDCNACVVFDGVECGYLPSAEQTVCFGYM